jgi:hypothetical protein
MLLRIDDVVSGIGKKKDKKAQTSTQQGDPMETVILFVLSIKFGDERDG